MLAASQPRCLPRFISILQLIGSLDQSESIALGATALEDRSDQQWRPRIPATSRSWSSITTRPSTRATPKARSRVCREQCPMGWSEGYGGFWVTTRYDDVAFVAATTRPSPHATTSRTTACRTPGSTYRPHPTARHRSRWTRHSSRNTGRVLNPPFAPAAIERLKPPHPRVHDLVHRSLHRERRHRPRARPRESRARHGHPRLPRAAARGLGAVRHAVPRHRGAPARSPGLERRHDCDPREPRALPRP